MARVVPAVREGTGYLELHVADAFPLDDLVSALDQLARMIREINS